MACAGHGYLLPNRVFSNRVIEEELKDVPSEDVPPLTPLTVEVKTEQEEKLVKQLSKMIRIVGDRVQHDQEFQDVIDGVASGSGSKSENFRQVADKVFEDGITWERIAVLIYVAGRLAVKVRAERRMLLSVSLAHFRRKLLKKCTQLHSELRVSSMSSHSYGLIIIFLAGMFIGSFITWRLSRQS
uniref:Bcl-2 Bcl-2 homology region 1-3 domain-containing protein n=1 Tax=Neolamprologus brichardi TaxID=32507 RepID=A0A3Q4MAT4_NEOBR